MNSVLNTIFKYLLKRNVTKFLNEKNIAGRNESFLRTKLRKLSTCNLGKKLGIEPHSTITDIPLTGYDFYQDFFINPREGDLLYPIKQYVRALTSGTMSKPKTFLLPRIAFKENIRKTGLSIFMISTHDGDRYTLEMGDVVYGNYPGGNFLAAFLANAFKSSQSRFFSLVPENSGEMTFQDKVDYFVQNHKSIDVAFMPVTTLIDDIRERVEEPVSLKGFLTYDVSSIPLKEEIKEFCQTYPSTFYGSTETLLLAIPSVEHHGGFFFDWRFVYPEFIHEEHAIDPNISTVDDPPDTLSLWDLEVGERYQLVATPFFNDSTRYLMPDILECISDGDNILSIQIPVFKYYSRSDKLLSLHNFTRINEEEMVQVLKNAGIPFLDFTVRKEMESAREYLSIYLELRGVMSEQEVYDSLNRELMEYDKDWRDLSNFMNYTPLRVNILPENTFKKYLESLEGQVRVSRMGMRDERFQQLLGYGETNTR